MKITEYSAVIGAGIVELITAVMLLLAGLVLIWFSLSEYVTVEVDELDRSWVEFVFLLRSDVDHVIYYIFFG